MAETGAAASAQQGFGTCRCSNSAAEVRVSVGARSTSARRRHRTALSHATTDDQRLTGRIPAGPGSTQPASVAVLVSGAARPVAEVGSAARRPIRRMVQGGRCSWVVHHQLQRGSAARAVRGVAIPMIRDRHDKASGGSNRSAAARQLERQIGLRLTPQSSVSDICSVR